MKYLTSETNKIKDLWNKYIQQEEEVFDHDYTDSDGKKYYRISGIGSCFLKQIHGRDNLEKVPNKHTRLKLRTGTVMHKEMEKLFTSLSPSDIHPAAKTVLCEYAVISHENRLIGHPDLAVLYEDYFDVYDFKFIADYYYRLLFGHKKNRDPNAGKQYEMQIVQYAKLLEEEFDLPIRKCILVYFKKSDTSTIKAMEVDIEKVTEGVIEYWAELQDLYQKKEEIIPGLTPGCPMYSWECETAKKGVFCPFYKHCWGPEKIRKDE